MAVDNEERRVERLPEVATVELIASYERAARLLRTLITSAIRRGSLKSADQRKKQLTAVERVLADLRQRTEGLTGLSIAGAYQLGATAADASAEAVLPEDLTEDLLKPAFASGANQGAVQAIQASVERKLEESLIGVGRSAEDVFRRVGLEEVGTGVAAGLSRRETSKRIATRLAEEGLKGFTDKSGRQWKLDTYARMVARSTQREAMTLGTVDRLLQVGLDLVTISDHNTKTPLCQLYEGKTYSLTGNTEGYEKIPAFPPFHPNCEHVLGAAKENFELLGVDLEETPPAAKPKPSSGSEARSIVHNVEDGEKKPEKLFRDQIDHGLRTIEKVHSFPTGLKIVPTIKTGNLRRGQYGSHGAAFLPNKSGKAESISSEILISRRALRGVHLSGKDAGRPGPTSFNGTVHETGHYLDSVHLGDFDSPQGTFFGRKPESRYASQYGNEEYDAWREAIKNSEAGSRMRIYGSSYQKDWTEIWARSYEQWIAERSGDEQMKAQIRAWTDGEEEEGKKFVSYWTDPEDFAPVAKEIEKLFAKRGLLKK